jgi:hypothetical protein
MESKRQDSRPANVTAQNRGEPESLQLLLEDLQLLMSQAGINRRLPKQERQADW